MIATFCLALRCLVYSSMCCLNGSTTSPSNQPKEASPKNATRMASSFFFSCCAACRAALGAFSGSMTCPGHTGWPLTCTHTRSPTLNASAMAPTRNLTLPPQWLVKFRLRVNVCVALCRTIIIRFFLAKARNVTLPSTLCVHTLFPSL